MTFDEKLDEAFDAVVNLLKGYEGKKLTVPEAKQATKDAIRECAPEKRTDWTTVATIKEDGSVQTVADIYNAAIAQFKRNLGLSEENNKEKQQ